MSWQSVLLERKADVNAKNKEGQTPFDFAKAGFNEKDPNYFSSCNMILCLINKRAGYKINAQDSHGRALLHYAAIGGHLELANLLLARGADVNAQDNRGCTPLYKATLSIRSSVSAP